ncbi:hypothetical protein D9M68_958060 [compost metagenome]
MESKFSFITRASNPACLLATFEFSSIKKRATSSEEISHGGFDNTENNLRHMAAKHLIAFSVFCVEQRCATMALMNSCAASCTIAPDGSAAAFHPFSSAAARVA